MMLLKNTKKIVITAIVTLVVLIGLSVLKNVINITDIKISDYLAKKGTDNGYFHNLYKRADENIVILTIDDLAQFDFAKTSNSPLAHSIWTRNIWANIIDYLETSKPKVILFDIMLDGYEDNSISQNSTDMILANTLKKYSNIVAITHLGHNTNNIYINDFSPVKRSLDINLTKGFAPNREIYLSHTSVPDIFINNTTYSANNLEKSKDNIVRNFTPIFTLIKNSKEYYIPSSALAVVLKYLNYDGQITIKRNKIYFDNRKIPVNIEGQTPINWHGTNETYPTISLTDFVTSLEQHSQTVNYNDIKIPLSFFKDKIVIVSTNTNNINFYNTQVAKNMNNAQIQATIIDNLINDTISVLNKRKFVTFAPYVVNLLFCLLFGVLTIHIYNVSKRTLYGFIYTSAIYICIVGTILFLYYLPYTRLYISLTLLSLVYFLISIAEITYRTFFKQKKKLEIVNLFKGYVSNKILSDISRQVKRVNVKPTKRITTVLVSDIKHFSTYAQIYDTQYLFNKTNEVFDLVIQEILKYGGTFDKFIDDSVIAFWGAPYKSDNDELNAIKCALSIKEKLKNEKFKLDFENHIDLNFAIHTGESFVGRIGNKKYSNYTIIGNSLNIALKIKKLCNKSSNNILISESTYKPIKTKLIAKYKGEVKIKSQGVIVKVFEPFYEIFNLK